MEPLLLESLGLLLFIKGLFSFLSLNALLSFGSKLSVVDFLMLGLVGSIKLHSLDLALDIGFKVLFLKPFPPVAVHLDTTEGVLLLVISELTVLSTSVQANNKLHLGLLVRASLDLGPLLIFWYVIRSVIVLSFLISHRSSGLIEFSLFFFLQTKFVLYVYHVLNSCIERSFIKARVVLEFDGQVRSKSGDLVVVHARLTNNFFDYLMDR